MRLLGGKPPTRDEAVRDRDGIKGRYAFVV